MRLRSLRLGGRSGHSVRSLSNNFKGTGIPDARLPGLRNAITKRPVGLFEAYMSERAVQTVAEIESFMKERVIPSANDILALGTQEGGLI